MVQPSFSHPRKATSTPDSPSPTAALDVFLDNQHQSYFEELYKSEAVCICVLRSFWWSNKPVFTGTDIPIRLEQAITPCLSTCHSAYFMVLQCTPSGRHQSVMSDRHLGATSTVCSRRQPSQIRLEADAWGAQSRGNHSSCFREKNLPSNATQEE